MHPFPLLLCLSSSKLPFFSSNQIQCWILQFEELTFFRLVGCQLLSVSTVCESFTCYNSMYTLLQKFLSEYILPKRTQEKSYLSSKETLVERIQQWGSNT